MTYAISKRGMYDYSLYVTAIKQGGLSMDNKRIWDDKLRYEAWDVRTWPTYEAAQKQLNKLANVGGFDDYLIVNIAAAAAPK